MHYDPDRLALPCKHSRCRLNHMEPRMLQLNKLGKIFISDFSVTRQPRVRPKQADSIMERPKDVSSLVRHSPATAAAAKLVRCLGSCDTQQKFGTPQTRGAERFDLCGTLVGQEKYCASLARHRSRCDLGNRSGQTRFPKVVDLRQFLGGLVGFQGCNSTSPRGPCPSSRLVIISITSLVTRSR